MWLAILFSGMALAVANGVYFIRHLDKAVAALAPRVPRGVRRGVSAGYLVVVGALPAVMLGFTLYVLIARPEQVTRPGGPVFDALVVYPFWLVTVYSFQCTVYYVIFDVLYLFVRRRPDHARWLRRKRVAVAALAAVFAVYVPVRVAIDARSLEVRQHELVRPELPAALDGFKIAVIADLQADDHTGPERLDQLVDAVNAAHPDLVLIAGDLISSGPDYIETAAEAAGKLKAPYGVLSAVGDHDHFAYFRDRERSVREVTEALARHGVDMVDDGVRTIEVNGARIGVALLSNHYMRRLDRPTADRLLEKIRGADLRVAVVHQANGEVIPAARRHHVDLLVAGHTHGGQVNLLFPLPLTPTRAETPYLTGAHQLGDTLLVVSSGLGVSLAPFRYRAPATVDLVTLRRR